jgi:ABC-2 type transport system permease protein
MFTELRYALARLRGRILGWGLGLGLYSLWMIWLYEDVAQIDFEAYLEAFPREMLAFFGSMTELASPPGFIDTYYFGMMTLIVGILAIGVGTGLLVNDEEAGILDLVLAHPIGRTALFWARYASLALCLAIVLFLGQLGWILPPQSALMGLTWIEFMMPVLPLYAVLLLFGTLAFLLSMALPSGRLASAISGGLLVANYLLVGLARLDEGLDRVVRLTPLYYYQGGWAVRGLEWGWVAGLLAASVVMALAAWALFLRRDIRVGGEHEWGLGRGLRRLTGRAPTAGSAVTQEG